MALYMSIGHSKMLSLLLNVTNDRNDWKKYLTRCADISGKPQRVHFAAQCNNVKLMKQLILQGPDIIETHCKNAKNQSPLALAPEIVRNYKMYVYYLIVYYLFVLHQMLVMIHQMKINAKIVSFLN